MAATLNVENLLQKMVSLCTVSPMNSMEGLRWLKCAEPYADMCHFEAVRPLEAPCSVAELSPLAEPLEEPLEEEAWLWSAVCRCCRIEWRPS